MGAPVAAHGGTSYTRMSWGTGRTLTCMHLLCFLYLLISFMLKASMLCIGKTTMRLLGVHSSGHQSSFLAGILITNDPFQRPKDDLGQLSMPVGPEVPSALHTGNGPCADPLHATIAISHCSASTLTHATINNGACW